MRSIAVLTTGRQDWGILRGTCTELNESADFRLTVLAGGMACSPRFGRSVDEVRAERFERIVELDWLPDGDSKLETVSACSRALEQIGGALLDAKPEALLLVGDRYETLAAAQAATIVGTPIAHLHGGEETAGAIDNVMRHAITKMAHLHLAAHQRYADRIVAMGEAKETVHVVGAPGCDNAFREDLPDRAGLEAFLGMALVPPVVLVTLHPTTASMDGPREVEELVAAMDMVPATYVVTLPNVDPDHARLREVLERACRPPRRVCVTALGERRYWGMLRIADAMLGNSSSGLIEAPAVALPAVNVGDRQAGRDRSGNVVDTRVDAQEIASAVRRVLEPGHRDILRSQLNLPKERAAPQIVRILRNWVPPMPPRKRWAGA
ncbi:MAG: UDP-N-acetylglucosamine 2-epimerase (hydrolyzing) [Labilithrix sp.]|nr:UDP-N-acetylglucosamine 2-epimerase (hydrolyzing) [Labilithrix sp.]